MAHTRMLARRHACTHGHAHKQAYTEAWRRQYHGIGYLKTQAFQNIVNLNNIVTQWL